MALTRIEIVNQALDQAQLDSSFQAKGREWLNIIITKLSLRQNYSFYRMTVDTDFVVNQVNYILPADYQRPEDPIYYLDSNGRQGNGIKLLDPYRFQPYVSNANGFPSVFKIDDQAGNIVFNSAPSTVQGQKFRFMYFRQPNLLSTSSGADILVPDFEDQWTLMEELKLMAFEYLDDERYAQKKQDVKESNRDYQRLLNQSDGNSMTDLNQWNFRPTRRTWGNRGGWG